MKQKALLSIFITTCTLNLFAVGNTMELYGDPEKGLLIPRFEISVSYDETSVTLRSDDTLENVYVVIKDFDGNIIYNGWTVIDQQSNTIVMPIEEGTEKYTIEVYVDEECLVGYFD